MNFLRLEFDHSNIQIFRVQANEEQSIRSDGLLLIRDRRSHFCEVYLLSIREASSNRKSEGQNRVGHWCQFWNRKGYVALPRISLFAGLIPAE